MIGPERFRPPWKLLDKPPVKLLAGGTTTLRFSLPRGPQLQKLQLTLHDAPAGVSIEEVSLTSDGATVVLTEPTKRK